MGDLVGRDDELAVVAGLVRGVAAGWGRTLLIEGEPGAGKTALLAAALDGAVLEECEVLGGSCDELLGRFPLSVMTRILGIDPDSADPRRAQVAASLRETTGPQDGTIQGLAGDPVMAAVEELQVLVDQLCAGRPLVLFVEDLHWADESSLILWERLCRASVQLPLLLVGSCRPAPQHDRLRILAQEVRRQDGVVVSLNRLADGSVAELAARLTRATAGPRLIAHLRSAGGNPLYIRELVDALARAGILRTEAGTAEIPPADQTASAALGSLTQTIEHRLESVSRQTREMLRAAALLGPQFSTEAILTVTEHQRVDVPATVRESVAAGVLEWFGTEIRFRHPLLREVLYQAVPTAVRTTLQRHAAEALIAMGAPVEQVATMIVSCLEAADGWETEWLVEHAMDLVRRAPRLAEELLRNALGHTARNDTNRAVLEDQLMTVCYLLGHSEETRRLARSVMASTTDPARAGQARWFLGRMLLRGDELAELVDMVTETLTGGLADAVWQARLTALQAIALRDQQRLDEAATAAGTALAQGERLEDVTAMAYALHADSLLRNAMGKTEETVEQIRRALALIGDEPSVSDLRVMLLCNLGSRLDALNHFAEASIALRQARQVGEQTGTTRMASVRGYAAEYAFERGEWDDAVAELEANVDVDSVDNAWTRRRCGLLALIAQHRNDGQSAAGWLREQERQVGARDPEEEVATEVLARSLEYERAGRHRQAALEAGVLATARHEQRMVSRIEYLPAVVRMALAAGARDIAEAAADACRRDAERGGGSRNGVYAQWCGGLLTADPAAVLAAAESSRSAGRHPDWAFALEDSAALLAGAGDAAGARVALAQAQAIYTDLGAVWDFQRAAARLRASGIRLGVRGTRSRPRTGWDALTETELRIAGDVATGRSNPDIARDLLLSRRTVESHVSRILAKLDVHSRREVGRLLDERSEGSVVPQRSPDGGSLST